MAKKLLTDRNIQIAAALDGGGDPKTTAAQFGISYSNMYRAARAGRDVAKPVNAMDKFDSYPTGQPGQARDVGAGLFSEMAVSGLRRFGGRIDEESERAMNTLQKRLKIYREMGDDPIVATVLQAIKMTLRRVSWAVAVEGTTDADKQLAEWLETVMDDMSIAWTDVIDQALGMIQYGFYPAELVYKLRAGENGRGTLGLNYGSNAGDAPAKSKYDDGMIGWRKWVFMSPESLASGDEWIFDEHGGLAGLNQAAAPDYKHVSVPIKKMILFRTTAEKNNPEGHSLLRAMYQPYYLWRNLQEVEAISAERMGAGFPVMYLGKDVGKSADGSSGDMPTYREIVRDIRIDEQMGLVIPHAKMGSGAREGEGVLFEFATPPSRGSVDFNQVITRYETRGTMVGLAQFVHLGMNQVGARALGESSLDFFTLVVSAWADGLADTINRFAVERLIRLNGFTGMTAYPKITHEPVMKIGLAEIAGYVNALAGTQLITASPELENFLRKYAGLPEKPMDMGSAPVVEGGDEGGTVNDEGAQGMVAEGFADLRGTGKRGAKTREITAVNTYQKRLESIYSDWADDAADALAQVSEDDYPATLGGLLDDLKAQLTIAGRISLPNAVTLAIGNTPPTSAVMQALVDAMESNEGFLQDSLIPDAQRKLELALRDEDIAAAIGAGAGAQALRGVMDTMGGRVSLYAGEWWKLYNDATGVTADELGKSVTWFLDANAHHCGDCLQWGSVDGTEYDSYEAMQVATGGMSPADGVQCGSNCRCFLEYG